MYWMKIHVKFCVKLNIKRKMQDVFKKKKEVYIFFCAENYLKSALFFYIGIKIKFATAIIILCASM